MYVGDFNSHNVEGEYNSTNSDSQVLDNWASTSNALLVFNPKQPDSFRSPRWGTTTNPDPAFVNLEGPLPSRLVLDPFPCSQHRPWLISPINLVQPTQTMPLTRWNFRKRTSRSSKTFWTKKLTVYLTLKYAKSIKRTV